LLWDLIFKTIIMTQKIIDVGLIIKSINNLYTSYPDLCDKQS